MNTTVRISLLLINNAVSKPACTDLEAKLDTKNNDWKKTLLT